MDPLILINTIRQLSDTQFGVIIIAAVLAISALIIYIKFKWAVLPYVAVAAGALGNATGNELFYMIGAGVAGAVTLFGLGMTVYAKFAGRTIKPVTLTRDPYTPTRNAIRSAKNSFKK